MPFTRSTLSTIVNRITSDFETRITGATSLLRRSFLRIIARVNGGEFHLLYEYLDYQARQLFVTTADGAGLDTHASEWGVPRNAPVSAIGSGAGTGVNDTVIPEGTQLSSTDGQIYNIDEEVIIAGGVFTVDFTADLTGTDGNDDAGITLSFVTPVVGADTDVVVDSDGIVGGADEESDDSLRSRILIRKRQPPHGGIDTDYVNWALEISGVTRAWAIAEYQGEGTIGVSFVRDDDAIILPNSDQRDEMREYILEHTDPSSGQIVGAPVTAEAGLTIITLTENEIDFDIRIHPNTATVKSNVTDEIEDLLFRKGGPEETIYLSDVSEAISLGTGDGRHIITSPTNDIVSSSIQVHVLGTITYRDY